MPLPRPRFPLTWTFVGVRDAAAEAGVDRLADRLNALGVDLTAEYLEPKDFAPTPGERVPGGVVVLGNDATIDDPDVRRLFGPGKDFGSNANPPWLDTGADEAHRRAADEELTHARTAWWIDPAGGRFREALDTVERALDGVTRLPAPAFAWPAHRPLRPVEVPRSVSDALGPLPDADDDTRPVLVLRGRRCPALTDLALTTLDSVLDRLEGGVVAVDATGVAHPSDAFHRASRVDVEFGMDHSHAIGEDPRRAGTIYGDRWCESCDGPFALLLDGVTDPAVLGHPDTLEFLGAGHVVVATCGPDVDLSPLADGVGTHPVVVVDVPLPSPPGADDLADLSAAEREYLEFAALYDPALVPAIALRLLMPGLDGNEAELSLRIRALVSPHPYYGSGVVRLDPDLAEFVRPTGARREELLARVVDELPTVVDNLGLEGQEVDADCLVGLLDRNPDDDALREAVPTDALLFLARNSAHPALARVVHRAVDRLSAPGDTPARRPLFLRAAAETRPDPALTGLCLAALRLRPAPTGEAALTVARTVLVPARTTLRSRRADAGTIAATAALVSDARDLLEAAGAPASETLDATRLAVDATGRVRASGGTAPRPWIDHVHALISLGTLARATDASAARAAFDTARREIVAYRDAHRGTHMEHEIDALAHWLELLERG